MELFIVNRHEGDEQPKNQTNDDEQKKLKKVLKRIERKKRAKEKLKEKLALQQEKKTNAIEKRLRKKQLKADIVSVPKNTEDEFIDTHIKEVEKQEENEKEAKNNYKVGSEKIEGFTVLGADNFDKKGKVKRILPKWLSHPTVISVNLQNLQCKVSSMKCLDKSLRKKLKENGIKKFFPVQSEVIPWLLKANDDIDTVIPSDICVSAPTGSGKTLTFVLPIIQALKRYTIKRIYALVILPTQDLAIQVYNTFKEYAEGTNLDVCLVTGNVPFTIEQKKLVAEYPAFGYKSKIDILVCTAGRLVDHMKHTNGFDLRHLRFLVIDEADRVLETIQNDWLYHLENHIHKNNQGNVALNIYTLQKPRPPQKLLFSATLSQDPEKLQRLSLFQPKLFTSVVEDNKSTETRTKTEDVSSVFIGKYTTPKELTEKYIVCSMDLKPLVLYKLIQNENLTKTLIFTNSAESVHRLTILLRSLFSSRLTVEEISSNLEIKTRNAILRNFSEGAIDLLVCTDSLARGMDFTGVQCVISYAAPKYLKTYIHRAGRTARAGAFGLAVTMLHSTQVSHFMGLLKQAGKNNLSEIKIAEDDLEGLGKEYEEALNNLKQTVLEEKKNNLKKSKWPKRNIYLKRKRTNSMASNSSQK